MWRVSVMNRTNGNRYFIPCDDLSDAEEVEKIINLEEYSTDIECVEPQDSNPPMWVRVNKDEVHNFKEEK